MIDNLLWIFKGYRDLYFAQQILADQIAKRDRTIADLELQLTRKPEFLKTADLLLEEYQDAVREVPFKDGVIPDNFWLTPGENERVEVPA